jgi:hypothetical protein
MRLTPPFLIPSVFASCLAIFTILSLFPFTPQSWGAPSPPPATSLHATTQPQPEEDYNKPIIFFEEDSTILVFYPNGDIIYRGRKITTDYEVVRALQEILSLSPCRRRQ